MGCFAATSLVTRLRDPFKRMSTTAPCPWMFPAPDHGGAFDGRQSRSTPTFSDQDGEHRLVGRIVRRNVGCSPEFPKPFGS